MATEQKHISVCICTFKRPELLSRLLAKLESQCTDGLFSYSLVVVDNDSCRSAHEAVTSFRQLSRLDVRYFVEPVQNIARARNKAVENARGDFIAFIDDDEFPGPNWLSDLLRVHNEFNVAGVLGPVVPYYETEPPQWVINGKFHDRPSHKTGTILPWTKTRTGNALLRRDLFGDGRNRFRDEFGSGGEDRDFFRRMIDQGFQFIWCAEAPVFEIVPPERYKRSFMIRRALLRGKTPYNHSITAYLKSLIALPAYTLLLPFLFLVRHHLFMKYLIKSCDHIGRILSVTGIDVVKEKYVMK